MKKELSINSANPKNTFKPLVFFLFCAFTLSPVLCFAKSAEVAEDGWVSMPEGGRAAFVGVQGGTVPATVFSSESAEQTAQVGLTDNDFLQVGLGHDSNMVASEEMLPFGYAEQAKSNNNVASNSPKSSLSKQQRAVTRGFNKIFEEDQEPETLPLGGELTRI